MTIVISDQNFNDFCELCVIGFWIVIAVKIYVDVRMDMFKRKLRDW